MNSGSSGASVESEDVMVGAAVMLSERCAPSPACARNTVGVASTSATPNARHRRASTSVFVEVPLNHLCVLRLHEREP